MRPKPILALIHTNINMAPGEKILPAKEYSTLVKAAGVLKKAKEEIEKEAEETKEAAFEEGFQKGLEKWSHQLAAINEELRELREETQRKMLPLVMAAAKKVLGAELKLDPDRIVDIILNSLKPVTQHKKIVIYVNKDDLARIEKSKSRIRKIFEHLETLSIQERDDIEPGGCMIETEAGIINAQLENQWRALEAAFESFTKR